jgi:hypothetical protein
MEVCSKSPHGALNATSRQREQPKRIIITWLIGLVSPTLAAQLTYRVMGVGLTVLLAEGACCGRSLRWCGS